MTKIYNIDGKSRTFSQYEHFPQTYAPYKSHPLKVLALAGITAGSIAARELNYHFSFISHLATLAYHGHSLYELSSELEKLEENIKCSIQKSTSTETRYYKAHTHSSGFAILEFLGMISSITFGVMGLIPKPLDEDNLFLGAGVIINVLTIAAEQFTGEQEIHYKWQDTVTEWH